MNTIFENDTFVVHADSSANVYRVTNKNTNILEETTPSMYDALVYARLQKNLLDDFQGRESDPKSSWPLVIDGTPKRTN